MPIALAFLIAFSMAGLGEAGERCGLLYGWEPRTVRPEHRLRPNTAEDVTRLREAAEQGDALAQFSLGEAYEIGDGVFQDDAQAYAWYRKSAEQGLAQSQFSVGTAYAYGRGVQADDADAFEWFRKAADQGHARGQFEVAAAYHEARGVALDCRQAREFFRKAAEQGLAEAQFAYGGGFIINVGPVDDDFAIATEWFRKSAEQGFALAQLLLGVQYMRATDNTLADPETNVMKDVIEADKWFSICWARSASDLQSACGEARKDTERKMSAESIAEAAERALDWIRAFELRAR